MVGQEEQKMVGEGGKKGIRGRPSFFFMAKTFFWFNFYELPFSSTRCGRRRKILKRLSTASMKE